MNMREKLPNQESEQATLVGLHSVKNLLGHEKQISLFHENNIESFSKAYGVKINGKIERFGMDLTDIQTRVVEGILRGFTLTNYKGNMQPKDKLDVIKEQYAFGKLPSTYKYLNQIPCLRATQAQIIEWTGMNKRGIGDRERVVEALKHLGTAQYCFYYDRLALDKNGMPEKDSDAKWKKEEVIAVDTLFVIKEVRDKKEGLLEYYEIIPSAIFLDQRESYFLLIPYNWREEVRELVGNKKASSYTFRFLLFLRYQYELKRRTQKDISKSFIIKWNWEEIAVAVKMPESVYKRKKERANKILFDAYSVAKQLGYLKEYFREEEIDCFILNERKYQSSKGNYYEIENVQELKDSLFSQDAIKLFEIFHAEKSKKDVNHKAPSAKIRTSHLSEFDKILKVRPLLEISQLIQWGMKTKYWCSQISTPSKLRQNFGNAFIEMINSSSEIGNNNSTVDNKLLVEEFLKNWKPKNFKVKIEALNSIVEIGNGVHQPICIDYKEKGFKDLFENALRKWSIL